MALELTPKVQVLEGQGIGGHFEFRVLELPFLVVFKMYFPPRTPCCFVNILARLGKMPSKYPRCSTTLHGSNVSQI